MTGVQAVWVADDSSSGEDCPTEISGTITLNLTTTRICVYCSSDGGGSGVPGAGTPVTFPLNISSVEALTESDFTCDPCPTQQVKSRAFFAFCVSDSETTHDLQACDCGPCESSSS